MDGLKLYSSSGRLEGEQKSSCMTVGCSGHPAQPDFVAAVDKTLAEVPVEKKPLEKVTASIEELSHLPVRELKAILDARRISYLGVTEKDELVKLVDNHCRTVTYYES
jgi:hypothetical protein